MITRRAWAAARAFTDRVGLPPGGSCPAAEAAWRVILLVRAYQDTAEVLWRQSLIQALLSAQAPDGFDAISRSFRTYRETAEPWLEAERTREEAELRIKVQDFARYLVEVKPVEQTKVQRQVPKVFGQ